MKYLIALALGLVFALTAEAQKDLPKQVTPWTAVAARDGQATDFIYNYLFVDGEEKDVWVFTCIEQPCQLFKRGDAATVFFPDSKLHRIKVGHFRTEKFYVASVCNVSTGSCFKAAVTIEHPNSVGQFLSALRSESLLVY
jgi:hypothetical protein